MSVFLIGPQSRVENLDLGSTVRRRLRPLMSLCLKNLLLERHCFTGTWIHLPGPAIKCPSDPSESNSTIQPCVFFHLLPRMLPAPLDPPWSVLLLWRSRAVRRILVHRVIVSLILALRWARRPAIVVRRILVISPGSSLYAHKAILVFCEG